jgi:hypothetical protein
VRKVVVGRYLRSSAEAEPGAHDPRARGDIFIAALTNIAEKVGRIFLTLQSASTS